MTKDKFLNNAYSLLTVAIILMIAGMMYVNIMNIPIVFTNSDSPQVNPDISPKEEQLTMHQLYTIGYGLLFLFLLGFVASDHIYKTDIKTFETRKPTLLEIIDLNLMFMTRVCTLAATFGMVLFITFLMLTETF